MNPEDEEYEKLRKWNEEKEEEERAAEERMLKRQEKDQEELKRRAEEREEEERGAAKRLLEREEKEPEEFKRRQQTREEQELEAAERVKNEERDVIEQFKERERKEQEDTKVRLKQREREFEKGVGESKEREDEELGEYQLRKRKEERKLKESYKEQQSSKLFASLLPPTGSTNVNTHSGTIPVYYVIIGRGPAAIINHTTLRQSEFGKNRIESLPVMHIGFANPWTKYMQHGMGQPPHLLNLPGFKEHPDEVVIDGGFNSKHFGAMIDGEYNRLKLHYDKHEDEKVITNETWVVWIQTDQCEPLGHNGVEIKKQLKDDRMSEEFIVKIEKKLSEDFKSEIANLRLLVMNPKPANQLNDEDIFFVYASCIDICTGPGRPEVGKLNPISNETAEYKQARTAAWLSPEKWAAGWGNILKNRAILNGVEAIRDEVEWTANERVCVTAGGGVGMNAAERSRNEDCKLDWFGRSSLMPTFGNPRNDTFLRHPDLAENRNLNPGESKELGLTKDDQIIPCGEKLRYGYGVELAKAELKEEIRKIEVTLQIYTDTRKKITYNPKIKDYYRVQVGLVDDSMWDCTYAYVTAQEQEPSKLYDRLVLPNGQLSNSLGHPYYFARHLGLEPLTTPSDGRMVGLKAVYGKVRVLGAAAQMYNGYGPNGPMPAKKMWLFYDSLPVSAVPDGMIFSGINIAVANKYFNDENTNKNVNTASQDEILDILAREFRISDANLIAEVIVEKRRRNDNNGYANIDLVIEALKGNDKTKAISSLESIDGLLNTVYTKSEEANLLDEV
jgi:hypothetical protein